MSDVSRVVYNSHRWKQLRRRIMARDGAVCQRCGKRATVVDHITTIRERPDLAYDESNLRALCQWCNVDRIFRPDPVKSYPLRRGWLVEDDCEHRSNRED